jgi:hypothetical protein
MSQIGKQIKGDKLTSEDGHLESRTPQPGKSRTPLKKELRILTVNSLGKKLTETTGA